MRCKRCKSYNMDTDYSTASGLRCMECGCEVILDKTTEFFYLEKDEYLEEYEHYVINCNLDGWLRERK